MHKKGRLLIDERSCLADAFFTDASAEGRGRIERFGNVKLHIQAVGRQMLVEHRGDACGQKQSRLFSDGLVRQLQKTFECIFNRSGVHRRDDEMARRRRAEKLVCGIRRPNFADKI